MQASSSSFDIIGSEIGKRVSTRLVRAGLPAAVALSLAAFAAAGPARPATTDCAKADIPAEYAICNSESLQDLDEKLDAAYSKQIKVTTGVSDRQKLARQQSDWTSQRDACKGNVTCLALRYQERLADLESGAATKSAIEANSGFVRFAGR